MKILSRDRSGTTFYCFSPMVMAATFLIEFTLALYVFIRYKLSRAGQIVVAILTCLATFQLAEYIICTGPTMATNPTARVGFVAITMLPPLGLHLVDTVAKSGRTMLVRGGYGMAAVISIYLVLKPGILATVCGHNYVMFDMPSPFNYIYGTYYYGVIIASLALAAKYLNQATLKANEALRWFVIGVMAFIIPTFAANVIRPETREAIPSIMCGFAVMFAMILAFRVAPQVNHAKQFEKLRFWN